MIELLVGKNEINIMHKRFPFVINAIHYESGRNIIDMSKPYIIARGNYIKDFNDISDWSMEKAISNIDNEENTIVFDTVNIDRALTQSDKEALKNFKDFFKLEETEEVKEDILPGKVYKQILMFNELITLLKDTDKAKSMLPVEIRHIIFFVKQDTEEDFILSMEAQLIGTYQVPNGNIFNSYKIY